LDFIDIDQYENIKSESYLKYDEMSLMTNFLEANIYETGESFCDVTIKLSDNVRTERREYTKLMTILGDVGGLMEVIFTLFRIMCSFSVDILYDISLVNNLFNFDLEKKLIMNKKREKNKKIKFKNDEDFKEIKHFNSNKYISRNTIKMSDEILNSTGAVTGSENRIKESEEIQKNNNNNLPETKKNVNYQNIKYSTYLKNYKNIINRIRKINKISLRNIKKKNNIVNNIKTENENNENNIIKIVNKIKINKACLYFCFLFARKRRNLDNILLDEGINIICEKLDVFNLFDKIYKAKKIQENVEENDIYEVMSKESKINLISINNRYK